MLVLLKGPTSNTLFPLIEYNNTDILFIIALMGWMPTAVDLSSWNVSKVKNMKMMFRDAFYANPDVSMWDVSNVINMKEMFYGTDINQNLERWDVEKVLNMEMMFYNAKYFNQDLSIWNVENVENCSNFFHGTNKWDLPKPNFINCDPN